MEVGLWLGKVREFAWVHAVPRVGGRRTVGSTGGGWGGWVVGAGKKNSQSLLALVIKNAFLQSLDLQPTAATM